MKDNLSISELFESLGYGKPGTDIDTAVRWLMVEAALRRDLEKPLECGDRIKVVAFSDAEGEEVNAHLLGEVGRILEIRGQGHDIGESPEDPVFTVEFSAPTGYVYAATFFREEIERA